MDNQSNPLKIWLTNYLKDTNERQKEFFNAREKFLFYGGAKSGGKSWAIRTKQILRRLKYPGSRGVLLRRTYPELLRNHIDKVIFEIPDAIAKYNSQKHQLTFFNKSVLEFGSAQYERDIAQYHGAEYDDIGVDEASQFSEFQFDVLRSVIRTTRTDLDTQMYLGANPGGVGHGWVKRRFITPTEPDPNYRFIPAKVYDNRIIMEADPDYVKELEKLPENLRRAYLDGDWDIFEGQFFTDWSAPKHIVSQFAWSLDVCQKIITYDWGYAAPGCALWLAFTPENASGVRRCYVYRELYQNQKTPEQWATDIKYFTDKEKVDYMVLPRDCFVKEGRASIADIFKDPKKGIGVPIRQGESLTHTARQNRGAVIHNYLAQAPDGLPYMLVHKNCRNLIRTLPEQVHDETYPELMDSAGEDHCCDSLGLGLMTWGQSTGKSGSVRVEAYQKERPKLTVNAQGSYASPDFWSTFEEAKYKKKTSKLEFE